jgi:GT2 family glycosyltransferase
VKRHISAYVLSANLTTMHRRAALEMDRHDMTNSAQPKVFVLILSYNGKKWLEECLPSVLAMDYPNYEVVVIDNGSSDGTAEYLESEFPEIQTVAINPNVGYARGFNAGIEYAATHGAEYFLIMNNDTVIDPNAVTELVRTAGKSKDVGFVSGKVYYHKDPLRLQTAGRLNDKLTLVGKHVGFGEYDVGQYDEEREYDFVDDVFLLVKKEVYERIGGYDENFFLHWEETDWCVRARRAGFRILYTPHAKIWHKGMLTTVDGITPLAFFYLTRNQIPFMWRNAKRSQFMVFALFLLFKKSPRWIARFSKRGQWKYLVSYILGIFSGFIWILQKKWSSVVDSYLHFGILSQKL